MEKIRCIRCGKTLLLIEYGKIEIKCPRCGHVMNIEHKQDNEQRERRQSS